MNSGKRLLMYFAEMMEQYRNDRQRTSSTQTPRRNILRWLIPNGGTLLIVAILLMTQSLWARPFAAPNAPGPSATTVNYQGRLADDAGVPLTGTYGMSFALYDAATAGNLIWGPESHTAVPVSEGLFSVGLGSQTSGGIPTTTWNGDRYLEITVGGETLSPRELIRSVPLAGMALTVPDGAIGSAQIADNSITQEDLSFPTLQLLAEETCNKCGHFTESGLSGWVPVKGTDAADNIEVMVTTQGGNLMVQATSRYMPEPGIPPACGIQVLQDGSQVGQIIQFAGSSAIQTDFSCSGTYLFTDLTPGTYAFRVVVYAGPGPINVEWYYQRQIAVYEFKQ
jgi:hypothetical protein